MQNLAEVKLWDKLVGALVYDPASQITTFEYSPDWVKRGVEIAPIMMPLPQRSSKKYQFPNLNPATYHGLPALFADTLPDDFGNAVINAWLAKEGRDSASFTSLERLLYIGSRGMGALEFEPAISKPNTANQQLELDSLIHMAQNILDQRGSVNKSLQGDDAMSALFQVGTSAGGARAKALVAINKDRTELRSGQVDAPAGFEHFLLKFDGVEEHKTDSEVFGDPQGFGRMEYAYYLMAKDAGINISHSELLIDGKRAHFITQRFERGSGDHDNINNNRNRKKHYISLCALDHADYKQPGAYSYEQLLSVARQLRLPREDAIEIYRRMVFNVIARNHDDHTKNTGFILDNPKASWRLSPAFDLAYSYKKDSPWVNAHQMSLNGKRDNFSRDDLFAVSELIGNFKKESRQIFDEVMDVVKNWQTYAENAGVFEGLALEIQKNLRVGL
ncbi:MAG: type II toxin-antitoxin system HipA family toxin [Cocleimonas sp.]